MQRQFKIAILGTRGIPARYGGFETFAEELSRYLTGRGHQVTVYCRRKFFQNSGHQTDYAGVRLIHTPTIMQKYLETPLHGLFSLLDLFRRDFDAVLLCNAANSPFAWLARLARLPIAINVDGIERERAKWSAIGRLWYRLGERCSVWFASRVVADAKVIADYYRARYSCKTDIIAYGAHAVHRAPGAVLASFALTSKNYLLYVSRLEPENNALGVIEAYIKSGVSMPLVIVGDAPYAKEYKASLQRLAAGHNVIFTGYQFGDSYQELQSNCYLYIQATEVGGTHPALIEAMAYGNCVIANGTPENIEVLGTSGVFYRKNDFSELASTMGRLVASPAEASKLASSAKERAKELYTWEAVGLQYERLFSDLIKR